MTDGRTPSDALLPHQQALVDRILNDPTVRGYVAEWEAGLGGSLAIAHLIRGFVSANPTCRVLVLNRRVLTSQTEHQLASVGLSSDLVDRFRFRAMEDAATASEPIWQEGGVYIVASEFAIQKDIASSLQSVSWDLLIIYETHQLRGQFERLVANLVNESPAIRLLWMTFPTGQSFPDFGIDPWVKSTVRLGDVVDAAGHRIFDFPSPEVTLIEVPPNPTEESLREAVAELVRRLDSKNNRQRVFKMVLERSMQSSLSALEGILRRLRNRIVHEGVSTLSVTVDSDEESGSEDDRLLLPTGTHEILVVLEKCLAEVDSISADPKFEQLKRLLIDIHEGGVFPRSTCVVTAYLSTLSYVETALDDLGFITFSLKGSSDFGERLEQLEECRENDGILLASVSALEGLSLPEIKTLIMYDVPQSPLATQRILGRFQRLGRAAPLNVFVLGEQTGIGSFREILLRGGDPGDVGLDTAAD